MRSIYTDSQMLIQAMCLYLYTASFAHLSSINNLQFLSDFRVSRMVHSSDLIQCNSLDFEAENS